MTSDSLTTAGTSVAYLLRTSWDEERRGNYVNLLSRLVYFVRERVLHCSVVPYGALLAH